MARQHRRKGTLSGVLALMLASMTWQGVAAAQDGAAPGQPDAPPIIVYRQPRPDRETTKEIMFYEAFDKWPEGGIAVGMADGHCEMVAEKSRFDELMK
jgi:hypothetical protein